MPFTSGTTPVKSDTIRVLLYKKLTALQKRSGALAANNPQVNDTIYRLRTRIDNALAGTKTK